MCLLLFFRKEEKNKNKIRTFFRFTIDTKLMFVYNLFNQETKVCV